jgi:hypothetical protein
MAVNPNTDFTAGAILTAAQQNRFPRGVMGYAVSTGDTALTTSEIDITGMSITFTAVANRLYKATFHCFYAQSATTRFLLSFTDGSNAVQNTSQNHNGAVISNFSCTFLFTASAGSVTRKIRASMESGTATVFGNPASNRTYDFIIEDVGPA